MERNQAGLAELGLADRENALAKIHAGRSSLRASLIRKPAMANSPNRHWYVHRRRPWRGDSFSAAANNFSISPSEYR